MSRITSYPYTLHLAVNDELKSNTPMPVSDMRRYHTFKQTDLRTFRDTLNDMADLCRMSQKVGVFAVGGMAPLTYVLDRLGVYQTQSISEIETFQDKFHVFGGLNWNVSGDENKSRFLQWMLSMNPGSQVVILDTGRVGNAAGQIFNFLTENKNQLPRPLAVQIVVIGQDNYTLPNDHSKFEDGQDDNHLVLIKDIVRVPDTATEDALYLAGYEKSREVLQLNPINVSGYFSVELEKGGIAQVRSLTTGQAFISVLRTYLDTLSVLSLTDILLS